MPVFFYKFYIVEGKIIKKMKRKNLKQFFCSYIIYNVSPQLKLSTTFYGYALWHGIIRCIGHVNRRYDFM